MISDVLALGGLHSTDNVCMAMVTHGTRSKHVAVETFRPALHRFLHMRHKCLRCLSTRLIACVVEELHGALLEP